MDYRTEPEDIERFATAALAWGTARERAVHIGFELGPLGSEQRQRFRRAATGQLWRVTVGGQHALLLLRKAAPNPAGETYAAAAHSDVPGSSMSFNGREGALNELLPDLLRGFTAWPAYAGIALHGLF